MRLVLFVVTNALALAVAAWLLDGITVGESAFLRSAHDDRWATVVVVGAILGLVNAVVKPVLNTLALPLIILSLGLMLLVTNALMLLLTSKIAHGLDLGFHVDGFWTAVGGGLVFSIATMVLEAVLPDPQK